MFSERIWILINIVTTIGTTVSVVFYNKWKVLIPGLQVREFYLIHYKTDIITTAPFMRTAWAIAYGSNLVLHILLHKRSSKERLLSGSFYLCWFLSVISVIPFTISYGYPKIIAMDFFLSIIVVSLGFALMEVMKKRTAIHEQLKGVPSWLVDLVTLDPPLFFITWTLQAIAFLTAVGLGYKDGPSDVAVPRGWCDPNYTCGTCMLFIPILNLVAWIYADIFRYSDKTKHVKLMYPLFWYMAISLFSNPHYKKDDYHFNQLVYIALAIISFTVWCFRPQLQRHFGKKNGKVE